jgi:pimeloyl-ACP methyl ester carboxylesterase
MSWPAFEIAIQAEINNLGGRYVWTDVALQGNYHIQRHVKNGSYRLLDGNRKRLLNATYVECRAALDKLDPTFEHDHLVLLIHGLGRHAGIMDKPKHALREAGFAAHSLNYATLFEGVDEHATHFTELLENLKGIKRVSFVTHSLGGLVAREILSRATKWGDVTADRLVMMGTPNQGAEIAEFLNRMKTFKFITGQSGQDVRPTQKLANLPEPTIPTLVIAGGTGTNIGFNPLLKGDNDGIVTLNETRLTTNHQFKRVKVIHTTIMDHPQSIKAMLEFLI